MRESVEYAVIGAGAIGSAAALYLARQNKNVVLLEQFELGHDRGSSHGESRIIRYVYEQPLYVRMSKEVYPLWAEIERDSGKNLYLKTGGLDLAPCGNQDLADCASSLKDERIDFEHLDAKEIRRRFPQFHISDDTEGLYQEDSGILCPAECVPAMHSLCRLHGVEIHSHFAVDSIEFEKDKIRIASGARQITARYLVLCPGGWAGPLLAQLGLDLPLTVSQEQYAFFLPEKKAEFLPGRFPVFIQRSNDTALGGIGWYGFPIYGRPGVKTAMHQTGKITSACERDFEVESVKLAALERQMRAVLPDAAGEIIHSATCLYTNTPDQNFVIDLLPHHQNVAFFAGCSGHAFKFAPLIGKLLVELLQHQKNTVPIELFSARRFSNTPNSYS